MTDRRHIESILKVNGISPTAPDEEIKSVLMSARFNNDEVDAAMMILRENVKTNETRVDGLHKVFRTDAALQPGEVSRLLGIDIDVIDEHSRRSDPRRFSFLELVLLSLASSLLAIVCLLMYMYSEGIGWFHEDAEPIITFTKRI
jgi:hypothetical protein